MARGREGEYKVGCSRMDANEEFTFHSQEQARCRYSLPKNDIQSQPVISLLRKSSLLPFLIHIEIGLNEVSCCRLPIHHTPSDASHSSPASGSRLPSSNTPGSTDSPSPPQLATFIDYARYTFASTSVPEVAGLRADEEGYGCLRGVGRGVKLGLKDLKEIVHDVSKEIEERGELIDRVPFVCRGRDRLFKRGRVWKGDGRGWTSITCLRSVVKADVS